MKNSWVKSVAKYLKGPALSALRKWVLEFLMKKVLCRVVGGVYGWLIGFAFDKIWKPYVKPLLLRAIRFFKKKLREKELRAKGKKTEDAKDENEWKDAVDDMFND